MNDTAEATATQSGESYTEIRIRGRDTLVRTETICRRKTMVTGKWLRTARVFDEELVEGEVVADSAKFIARLKRSNLHADVFTFAVHPPRVADALPFHTEWENWAIISVDSYSEWHARLPSQTRRNIQLARKRGVLVRSVPFDGDLVCGIQRIYNESPVRQGRRFWHYGKDLDSVKRVNETYVDRSEFIGAFLKGELIGFAKLVFVNDVAEIMQILSMQKHYRMRPTNALLAHAMQVCVERNCSFLVYGQYVYDDKTNSSLTEFKRRNRFEQIDFPRYYIPLTLKGRIAIAIGLHSGVKRMIPKWVRKALLRIRARSLHAWARTTGRSPREA